MGKDHPGTRSRIPSGTLVEATLACRPMYADVQTCHDRRHIIITELPLPSHTPQAVAAYTTWTGQIVLTESSLRPAYTDVNRVGLPR